MMRMGPFDDGGPDKAVASALAASLRSLVHDNLTEFVGQLGDPLEGLPMVFADAAWRAFNAIDFSRIAQVVLLKADESPAPRFEA